MSSWRAEKSRIFASQQAPLPLQSARKTAQSPMGRDDAMTRNQERDRIGAAGLSHRLRASRTPHSFGDFRVAARLARRDGEHRLPNAPLEFRPRAQVQRRRRIHGMPLQHREHRAPSCLDPGFGDRRLFAPRFSFALRCCVRFHGSAPRGISGKLQPRQATFAESSQESPVRRDNLNARHGP